MLKRLRDINNNDFKIVGGKAYNLGKLAGMGMNVPEGIVLTAEGYTAYINHSNTNNKLKEIFESAMTTLEKSKAIQELFIANEKSDEIRASIETFKFLDANKYYAVRSSSTLEDLEGFSFAGQYDTFLYVKPEALMTYILKCWASLWNERALEYRDRNNLLEKIDHCIIIQEMVAAKSSGVVFTANPISGLRDQVHINSVYGLGEGLVSGTLDPDQFIISKSGGHEITKQIATKEKMFSFMNDHCGYQPVAKALIKEPSLSQETLELLVDKAVEIEKAYGKAQDIEFAVDDKDQVFILQSRDITSLYPIHNLDHDGKLRAYMVASNVMIAVREPWTPLGANLYGDMFPTIINVMVSPKKPIDNSFVKYEGGRILIDLTYLLSKKFVAKQLGKAFSGSDLPLEDTMNSMIDKYGHVFTKQGIKFKIPFGFFKYGVKMIPKVMAAKKFKPEERFDQIKSMGQVFYQERKDLIASLNTVEEKWQYCADNMYLVFQLTQEQAMYCMEINNYAKIEKLLKKYFGSDYKADVLTYSLPGCYTQEMNQALNKLAKYFSESGDALEAGHGRIVDFMAVFGCRGNIELDFGTPRWREDPTFVINQIRSFMKDNMYKRNLQDIEDKANMAEAMIQEVYKATTVKFGKGKANKLKKLMVEYRIAAGMREYPKYNITQVLELARQVMLELGEDFLEQDLIDAKEDVFFLRKEDLLNTANMREVIKDYKAMYRQEMLRTRIPRLVLNNGETLYTANKIDPNSKTIQGHALSPGIYEGRVRIVLDPSESQLEEGEILVTETTNPAWTPLFMTAKALIMEHGGPLSHGGIVAREYGLPAVVGIDGVTDILKDGQLVRVNGDLGIIEILEDQLEKL